MIKNKLAFGLSIVVVVLAAALVYFIASNHRYSPESYVKDGENWTASVYNGGEMTLELDSNATTGYSWVITEKSKVFASDYNNYVADENTEGLVGTGGKTVFHMQALKEGTDTMTLQYKQDWEGGQVDSTYHLTMTVSRHNEKYLQIDDVTFEKVG